MDEKYKERNTKRRTVRVDSSQEIFLQGEVIKRRDYRDSLGRFKNQFL